LKFIGDEVGPIGSETIDIETAVGRVLAETVIADIDMPPFDRSQMDGFAFNAKDVEKTPVELKLVGESAAGSGWKGELKCGEAVRIMTGAPVPAGADAVQKLELAEETNDGVIILESVKPEKFIVPKGSEITTGKQILSAGDAITTFNIASLAAFGYESVKVSKQPRIAILATGSEIIDIGKTPEFGQIRNSNSIMLKALAEKAGATAKIFPTCSDNADDLTNTFKTVFGENFDILISTGGVSVGKYDLTKDILAQLGADIFFDKVKLKPGKPTVFAKLGKSFVFGLPGNPVSSAAAFCIFVRYAIDIMLEANERRTGFAIVSSDVNGTKERDLYLPVSIRTNKKGYCVAEPVNWQGSSDLVAFAKAKAFAFVPAGEKYSAGDVAKIIYI
jgi:molybdenum cofactor synthesis domain-containing protein